MNGHLAAALNLAQRGVPALPLTGKRPVPNCRDCRGNQCGGRPNMLSAGPCQCGAPCHGWAAATTDAATLTSAPWMNAWRHADATGWHPGGCGLTVVDLDDQAAVQWAGQNLPATRTVPTTRGQHWLYLGHMRSANAVRPGIDIKSRMAYAVWRGPGNGHMTRLPGAVIDLTIKKEEATRPAFPAVPQLAAAGPVVRARYVGDTAGTCLHTAAYVTSRLQRGLDILAGLPVGREAGGNRATRGYGVALNNARIHTGCPGPCGIDQLQHAIEEALLALGVKPYRARDAVAHGITDALNQVARGGLIPNGATT